LSPEEEMLSEEEKEPDRAQFPSPTIRKSFGH
jgi:hypothetical protein